MRAANLPERQADEVKKVAGPAVNAPEKAVAGFARKQGTTVDQLAKVQDTKGERYVLHQLTRGAQAREALAEKLSGTDVFRITLTAFLDTHTFDTRRVMKCCLAHLLPSGHVVPFCAYNTLYRDGTVPLPPLADQAPAPVVRSLPLV